MISLDGIDSNRKARPKPREQVKFGIIVDGAERGVEGEQKKDMAHDQHGGVPPSQKPGL